jgi:hypothetical protein
MRCVRASNTLNVSEITAQSVGIDNTKGRVESAIGLEVVLCSEGATTKRGSLSYATYTADTQPGPSHIYGTASVRRMLLHRRSRQQGERTDDPDSLM